MQIVSLVSPYRRPRRRLGLGGGGGGGGEGERRFPRHDRRAVPAAWEYRITRRTHTPYVPGTDPLPPPDRFLERLGLLHRSGVGIVPELRLEARV